MRLRENSYTMMKKDKLFWIKVWLQLEEPVEYKPDLCLPKIKKERESKHIKIHSVSITSTRTNIAVEGEASTIS